MTTIKFTPIVTGLFLVVFLLGASLKAQQEIEIIAPVNFIYEPVDSFELIIDFEIVNISNQEQTVFEVRTINDLPLNWTSSLCFGASCYAPFIDSVATEPPFAEPLQPGDTIASSIHVYTDQTSIGTAHVQIEVGTFNNPNDRETLDLYFTTDPSVDVEETEEQPEGYFLSQNYPNPFNPSTKIHYSVKEGGFVTLRVYNILGVEVATLVNGYKPVGNYETIFDAAKLSSGVYLYSLSVNGYTQTRKMILEK